MAKKRVPPKSKSRGKGGKGRYVRPLLIAGGSLLALTRSGQGIAPSVTICCLTERLRMSLRSTAARRSLMDDAVQIVPPVPLR